MSETTVALNIDCGRCGAGLEVAPDSHGRALVHVDEDVVCGSCAATNQMGVEDGCPDAYEDGEVDDYGDEIGTAYVSHWSCRHGVYEDDPCAGCDAEDEADPSLTSHAVAAPPPGAREGSEP